MTDQLRRVDGLTRVNGRRTGSGSRDVNPGTPGPHYLDMFYRVAKVAGINVGILSLKIWLEGRQKRPNIFSLACHAIVPPEVFCEAKMHEIHLQPRFRPDPRGGGGLRRSPTL